MTVDLPVPVPVPVPRCFCLHRHTIVRPSSCHRQIIVCVLLDEVMFFYGHWWLHSVRSYLPARHTRILILPLPARNTTRVLIVECLGSRSPQPSIFTTLDSWY